MKIDFHLAWGLKVGKVVKYFILSDLALWGGWGFVEPVFSVFIIKNIQGATLSTVGISTAVYWLLRAVLQIPISNYLDAIPGERDDFRTLMASFFLSAIASFLFIFVSRPWQLYGVQALHAVAFAFYTPSWLAIFSRHLDKNRTSFDWSFDNTVVGVAVGVAGFLGGVIANWAGFTALFFVCAVFSLVAALILLMAPSLLFPPPTSGESAVKDPHAMP